MLSNKTLKEKMIAKINASPKGRLFIVSDFIDFGSSNAIYKILTDLEKEGKLLRVQRGIYQKPKYSEIFKMNLLATPTEIAQVLARKNHWTIAPAKDLALNQLGLDTQVPNIYDFVSSGPSKEIRLDDGRKISFRHVTQREATMHPTSALVIEAFKQLGESGVTDQALKIVNSKLTAEQYRRLERDSKNSRIWLREKIQRMKEMAK